MGAGGGARGGGSNRYEPPKRKISIKPLAGIILEGLSKQKKASDQNMLDYEGEAAGVTTRRSNAQAMRERREIREAGGFEDNSGTNISNVSISNSPTKAEVSQSQAANATSQEDPLYLRKKKTQAKGRSSTILTSSKGVDESLKLGKKSLLGS